MYFFFIGFLFLESGYCSSKSASNSLILNSIDVTMAGLFYWFFGYGINFATGSGSNQFVGIGDFFYGE